MARSSIRVRLLFDDCTPLRPGSVGRRKCWFLLNIDACRRITDVEYCIQKTFCLGGSSQIELLLDDFVLPPFEKSEIIKENDLIRVRLLGEADAKHDEAQKKKKAHAPTKHEISSNVKNSRAKKKKKTKENQTDIDRTHRSHQDGLANDARGSKKEKTKGVAQQKCKENQSVAASGAVNGTPKNTSAVHKHSIKKVRTYSSSSSDSSSEDADQARISLKKNSSHKGAARRKLKQKSPVQSLNCTQSSANPGTSALPVAGSGNQEIKANGSKCNGSRLQHSETESSSTEEERVAGHRKPLKNTALVLIKKSVNDSVGSPKSKQAPRTRTVSSPSTSSVSSLSSASLSSDSDEHQQKQTLQTGAKPGRTFTNQELTNCPTNAKDLASSKNALVRKSVLKSSSGHVRFSSNSDGSESEAGDSQSSGSPSQVVKQMNLEPTNSMTAAKMREGNVVGMEESHGNSLQGKGCEHDDFENQSSVIEGNSTSADGIQTKLLAIAGQKPKQSRKPTKQVSKPEQPKKSKDYSSYPPLVGPPRAGDTIAYKILELSGLYTPEVSDYKEGEVINYNHSNSMIELRLSDVAMAVEPNRDGGKFEMESEEVDEEPAESLPQNRLVLVTLPSLIDPKLIT
ncbi:coilin-like [Lytechinus variegatus]|uniref:coilin-like n=1 Tax=Lytechinus variegatus TaxID=7654 RepID=UPI001BB2BBA1|nr:coilin-like [Lytechinus variegatus]